MMTFKSLFAYAVVFTAIVQVVHGEVSYACYGTRPQCDFYSMQCPQEHVIKLSNLYAGSKDTTIHTICNNSVQQCENSETCCSWKGTAGEIVQKLNVQNTYNTYKNCSGRQNCTAIHAPWQQLQTASNSLPTYSSFVHFEYACEEVSTKVPFCGGPSGSSDFTSDYAEIMFDGSQESFDPSKASKECQCIVTNLLGRQNTVKFTTIDVRLESHNKGENQTSADCSSASLSSYVLSSTCTASENHYEDNFYRRNRQATLTMLSGGQLELSLTNIHQNGSQDSPAMVWISVEAEESNSIKVTCKEVIPAEFTTTTTTTTTPKPTTTTTTTTTPKPTTTTTTRTPKPTTTTTTTTTPKPTTSTTTTTPKPTTTTTTRTTPKPTTTTTTTTTPKPTTTTTTTTTPKPTTTTTTTTTPKPTTTTTTTTPKPKTTTTTTTTPKPTTTTTTTTTTSKPTTIITTTTPKPKTTTPISTPKPTTITTTSTQKPTTTTATTPKPTTTSTASTPESTTSTSTSTPKPSTTAAPATTTVYLESTTTLSGGFLPREGDGESDSQQHTAVYLAIFIPVVVCLFFITALLLWIYWKRTIPKKKKFHFMKSTPRSEVYNTFSNPMILDDFIKDVHAKPVTPVLSEKPPISTFISVPEPRKRPKSILVSNASTNKQVKQPEPYIIPVNVRKSDSLYTTPRKEPVQNVVHVRLSQALSDRDKPVIITETVEPEVRPMQQGGNQAGEPAKRQSTLRKKADDNDDGAVVIHVDNLSLPPVSARSTNAESSGNTSPASTRSVIGSTPGNLTPERRNSEPALISTDPILVRHSASAYVLPGSSPEDSSVLFVP